MAPRQPHRLNDESESVGESTKSSPPDNLERAQIPYTDVLSAYLVDDAVDTLAKVRSPGAPADPRARLSCLASLAAEAIGGLGFAVTAAIAHGYSWDDVALALAGTTDEVRSSYEDEVTFWLTQSAAELKPPSHSTALVQHIGHASTTNGAALRTTSPGLPLSRIDVRRHRVTPTDGARLQVGPNQASTVGPNGVDKLNMVSVILLGCSGGSLQLGGWRSPTVYWWTAGCRPTRQDVRGNDT
ncbi:MAG: hypothetical protein M0Z46_07870 [Actinomycetota bacterium]|jgi:hypothetical protein|nr:hypothetical protein [Actinomycetota bacterium]